MAHRPKSPWTSRDPHDGPWSTCDRCGLRYSQNRLQFQYDYLGGSVPQSLGLLVCSRTCLDALNYQQKLLILPPDPQPIFNTRPENYFIDEANFLLTQDGSIITTETGVDLVTSIPNPQDIASTSHFAASLRVPSGSVATLYMDIFFGNPLTTGVSVLSVLTGSATRINIASQLTTVLGVAKNTDTISVGTTSANATNTNYVAFYNAASGGTLLMSGVMSASPTVAKGVATVFDALGLQININP